MNMTVLSAGMSLVQSQLHPSDLEQQEPLGCCFTPTSLICIKSKPAAWTVALTEELLSNLKMLPRQNPCTLAEVEWEHEKVPKGNSEDQNIRASCF